jgi:hypothetical protein
MSVNHTGPCHFSNKHNSNDFQTETFHLKNRSTLSLNDNVAVFFDKESAGIGNGINNSRAASCSDQLFIGGVFHRKKCDGDSLFGR